MARLRTICSVASPCPLPRRDASVTIIDSSEGSSGKLVVFGGLTGTQSSADYFVDDTRFLSPLDDIWVLDLDQVPLFSVVGAHGVDGLTHFGACADQQTGVGRTVLDGGAMRYRHFLGGTAGTSHRLPCLCPARLWERVRLPSESVLCAADACGQVEGGRPLARFGAALTVLDLVSGPLSWQRQRWVILSGRCVAAG